MMIIILSQINHILFYLFNPNSTTIRTVSQYSSVHSVFPQLYIQISLVYFASYIRNGQIRCKKEPGIFSGPLILGLMTPPPKKKRKKRDFFQESYLFCYSVHKNFFFWKFSMYVSYTSSSLIWTILPVLLHA